MAHLDKRKDQGKLEARGVAVRVEGGWTSAAILKTRLLEVITTVMLWGSSAHLKLTFSTACSDTRKDKHMNTAQGKEP